MFLAVWLLYAADRLLDARDTSATLQQRHHFHHRHTRLFLGAMGCALLALIPLVLLLPRRDLLLYIALAILLAAWFALIHVFAPRRALPKELAAAAAFAAAIAIPTHAPALTTFLFGALCAFNLFLISHWESPRQQPHPCAPFIAPSASAVARSLTLTTLILILLAVTLVPTHPAQTLVLLAIACAAAALLSLHLIQRRVGRTTLRALADLALLTPILFWPWLR